MLALLFAIELGAVTESGWLVDGISPGTMSGPVFYTMLESEIVIADVFFLNAFVRTDVQPVRFGTWSPFRAYYGSTIGMRIGIVEIAFRHACYHPVTVYTGIYSFKSPALEGGHSELYLRINGGIR